MEIFTITCVIGGIIAIVMVYQDIQRGYAIDEQFDKEKKALEDMRYYFWLTKIGLEETAHSFNNVGLHLLCGELV